MKTQRVEFYFLIAALLALIAGVFFGVIGGLQYLLPDFLNQSIPFNKTRPLHVTLVITWIFTGAIGGIYYYIPLCFNKSLYSSTLAKIHFLLFIATGISIIACYFLGYFGGREYLEFPPWLALPMLLTWILFLINFFMAIPKKINEWKVYHWMWSTGILFFLITFGEAYLWTIPFFRNNIIRDIIVQWKAAGAMVGSWNMLVYGTGFYVMEKISGNDRVTKAPVTFFFYFLGLTNLMFNWGHHTYIVPAAGWIRTTAYIISMTELLILGNIILNWRKSLSTAKKNFHNIPYRFIAASDVWIFLNLSLAICISIPAINYYTHGTHITVAHAMGSTIGINTMLLLSSLYFIGESEFKEIIYTNTRKINVGFWMINISLLLFWISLIASGITKALEKEKATSFQLMMTKLSPWFHGFMISGLFIFLGILLITIPLLLNFTKRISSNKC